jgi:hypothetical protein
MTLFLLLSSVIAVDLNFNVAITLKRKKIGKDRKKQMKNTKTKGVYVACVIGLLVFLLVPALAVDLDYNVAVTATDVSRVKVTTEYVGITNETVTQYSQYVYSVGQEQVFYEADAYIGDNHDISTNTTLSAVRSLSSGIAGNNFVENAFIGERNLTKSQSSFGIRGHGRNLTVASFVVTTPVSLDQTFAIEADYGEAGTGWVKRTDNVTIRGGSDFRARRVVIAGHQGVTIYPAGPAEEDDLKSRICPWGGSGRGYPVFTPRGSNGENYTASASAYKVWRK